jgi:hypothetical protein
MNKNKILETWLKWLRNGEWYNVTDDIERLLLEPERDVCWCGVPLAKPDMPTKIFGPNLEQILNAAGFYKRQWVGLTDDELVEIREAHQAHIFQLMFAVEAKIREKNNAV